MFAAPAEERILEKLVWPLLHAKGSYMVGNYLGTISLCGMVCEMLAILIFEVAKPEINGARMTETSQRKLFGRTFEKLGQDRRVSILYAYDLIADELKASFDRVRRNRSQYLHLWSKEYDKLSIDAVECYRDVLKIVAFVLGQNIRDGKLLLEPKLTRYLRAQGVFVPPNVET